MAIKLLENTGIENTGIGASALNNLITGNKSGIVGKYLNECAFTTTGNTIIIDKGLLIICGRQVEINSIYSITLSSVPSEDVRYQIVIELTREESGEVTASIFARQPSTLIQENLMKDGFVYQFELGRVTHKTTGQVTEVLRTADILYGQSGAGADIEVGEVTTQMISTELPAEVNINKTVDGGKTKLNFDFSLPKPYEDSVTGLVYSTQIAGNPVTIRNTNNGFIDRVKILNDTASAISSPLTGKSIGKNWLDFANATFYDADYSALKFNLNTTQNNIIIKTATEIQVRGGISLAYQGVATLMQMPVGTYKLSAVATILSGTAPVSIRWATYANESDAQNGSLLINQGSDNVPIVITEANQWLIVGCFLNNSDPATTASLTEMQLKVGTTASDYEPYTASAFSIPLKDTSGTVLDLNPADVIEMIDGKYHLNDIELADESQDALRAIPTYQGQTNLYSNQPFTFDVTEFQLGLESIDAMLTLPDGTRVNVLTKDRMVYITSGEYKGKTLDYVLQEIKQYVAGEIVKQPNKTYVLYHATAGANNLYLSAATYTHTYAAAGAYLITISGTGSLATVDWGDGTSGTVDFTGGFNINNQTDKEKYIEVHLGTNCAVIGNYAFEGCYGLTSITIPNSVTSIGEGAFYNCSGLTSITIPNSVTSIGSSAFRYCIGLTSITIPNSVTSISGSAFYNCSGLTSITIPNSVTSIGEGAFAGCTSLTSINFLGSTLPTIGAWAFEYCRIADIIAQTSSLADSAATAITDAGGRLLTNYRKLY